MSKLEYLLRKEQASGLDKYEKYQLEELLRGEQIMSKMSQLHAELSEQASELGFESIEQAEANGYEVVLDGDKAFLVPDINKAYEELDKEIKAKREAKQIEMVYEALNSAKKAIALIYKDEDAPFGHPSEDIKDEKIQSYYYTINEMCLELAERNVMLWQKED